MTQRDALSMPKPTVIHSKPTRLDPVQPELHVHLERDHQPYLRLSIQHQQPHSVRGGMPHYI